MDHFISNPMGGQTIVPAFGPPPKFVPGFDPPPQPVGGFGPPIQPVIGFDPPPQPIAGFGLHPQPAANHAQLGSPLNDFHAIQKFPGGPPAGVYNAFTGTVNGYGEVANGHGGGFNLDGRVGNGVGLLNAAHPGPGAAVLLNWAIQPVPQAQAIPPKQTSLAPKQKKTPMSPNTKRVRHMESENRRRDNIRAEVDKLCGLVPGLAGRASNEILVFEKTAEYLADQIRRKPSVLKEWRRRNNDGSGVLGPVANGSNNTVGRRKRGPVKQKAKAKPVVHHDFGDEEDENKPDTDPPPLPSGPGSHLWDPAIPVPVAQSEELLPMSAPDVQSQGLLPMSGDSGLAALAVPARPAMPQVAEVDRLFDFESFAVQEDLPAAQLDKQAIIDPLGSPMRRPDLPRPVAQSREVSMSGSAQPVALAVPATPVMPQVWDPAGLFEFQSPAGQEELGAAQFDGQAIVTAPTISLGGPYLAVLAAQSQEVPMSGIVNPADLDLSALPALPQLGTRTVSFNLGSLAGQGKLGAAQLDGQAIVDPPLADFGDVDYSWAEFANQDAMVNDVYLAS